MAVFASRIIKLMTGHRRHFGYHSIYAGHLADSCASCKTTA